MAMPKELTDDDIETLATDVLGGEMADLGFAGVEVHHRDIYADGSSLFIDVRVAADVPAPFDGERFGRLRRLVQEALLEHGEDRFPHVSLHRAGDEAAEPDHIPVDP